jgi:hypothetical protein
MRCSGEEFRTSSTADVATVDATVAGWEAGPSRLELERTAGLRGHAG